MTECGVAATAQPGVDTLAVLAGVDPAGLSASDLVDAVIASERLLAHVNGVQVRLLAELGLPNRCADVSGLVAALVDKAGMGRGADGEVAAAVVAELTADRSVGVAAAEVAAVLDWSPVTAGIRIRQAMRMTGDLPGTAAALLAGRVDVGRARMIVDRTRVLSPQLCAGVERRVLPLVRGRSKARLEALVDREVIAADPAAAENRRAAAARDRNVSHRVDKDGMGVITAMLPAEAAVMVFTLVDLIAAANKGVDGRSVDQRRADAIADIADELLTYGFVDLDGLVARADAVGSAGSSTDVDGANGDADSVDGDADSVDADAGAGPDSDVDDRASATGSGDACAGSGADADVEDVSASTGSDVARPSVVAVPPRSAAGGVRQVVVPVDRAARLARAATRHGRRPHLVVTGAWTTLAGLDDLPGHLDGYGTITAELLRAIATSWGTVTAVGVDAGSGRATGVGGLTYRAGRRVSDQVIAVSGWCRAAGCRMPADKCDLDHVKPFNHHDPAAGGRTVAAELLPFCRFHHLLKHHTDWTPQLRPDMTVVWTTGTGHTATSYPREFTAPGEWDRAAAAPGRCGADPRIGGNVDGETFSGDRGGALPAPAPEPGVLTDPVDAADPPVVIGAADPPVIIDAADPHVIIGPVVAGPTIPVIPAGTEYHEPHTELEDPTTVPHPGSVEINTYRALRDDTRQHALRRIRRIAALSGRKDASHGDRHINGGCDIGFDLQSDADRHSDPDRDISRPPAGPHEIAGRFRAAQSRFRAALDVESQSPGFAAVIDPAATVDPLPDEPPF